MLNRLWSLLRGPRAFARDVSGSSTVEFVVMAPTFIVLLLGGYETANYVRASLRVEMAASSIAQMLSQLPPSPAATVAGDGLMTSKLFHFFYDSTMYTLPDSLVEAQQTGVSWWDLAQVSFWSVKFVPNSANCGATCVYTPKVVWSTWLGPGCNATFQQVPDDSALTTHTLPASVYGPGSVIVAQINYKYYPTFGASLFGASTISRTAILSPRNTPLIESNATADSAGNCPNMP